MLSFRYVFLVLYVFYFYVFFPMGLTTCFLFFVLIYLFNDLDVFICFGVVVSEAVQCWLVALRVRCRVLLAVCLWRINGVVPVMYVCGLWLVVAEGVSGVYLVLFRGDRLAAV